MTRAQEDQGPASQPADPDEDREGSGAGTDTADQGSDASAEVQADLDQLTAAEQQRDEYLELAQRTKADFENYRKRMAAEVQAASARGKAELAGGLIGVIDNLERALEAAGTAPGAEAASDEPLSQGIVLTYRELCGVLERAGVESYDPRGERFDPSWHEALQKVAVDGGEAGIVVETMQKGYRLGDQVLRAARVVVSE